MLFINILAVAGNIFLAVAKFGPSHVLIIIGRALTGLHCGKWGQVLLRRSFTSLSQMCFADHFELQLVYRMT